MESSTDKSDDEEGQLTRSMTAGADFIVLSLFLAYK